MLSVVLSAVHLLSLAAGLACLASRYHVMAAPFGPDRVKRVLTIDNVAGLVAITWIGSGLWRAFGGVDKGTDFYLASWAFWLKMGLLCVVLGVEMLPMITFIRWRMRLEKGLPVDTSVAPLLRRLTLYEMVAVALMVFVAAAMARGVGRMEVAAEATPGSGAALYVQHCAPCHQADGRGQDGKLAANFVDDRARLAKSDEELLRSISDGVPGTAMVGFRDRLDETQRREVLAHLRARFGTRD